MLPESLAAFVIAAFALTGSPGPATLGMDEPEMKEVASIIGGVLRNPEGDGVKEDARQRVRALCERFPAYAS